MSRIIELTIDNEWIRGDRVFAGASGSHDDVILRMDFKSMWDGLTKTVEFQDAYHENAVVIILTTDMLVEDTENTYDVPIPAKAKAFAGKMVVTVKGVTVENNVETKAVLTVYGEFEVKESLWNASAEVVADITPTLASQLQAEVDSIKSTIVQAVGAAEDAAQSAAAALQSASDAEDAADAAEASAAIATAVVDMTVSSETKNFNEPASVTKTESSGVYNLHFGIPKGTPGVSVQAGSYFGFYIDENSHLHVVYADESADNPTFTINEDGHLIMTLA
jgi:hypothetical protein